MFGFMRKAIFVLSTIGIFSLGLADWEMKQFAIEHYTDARSTHVLQFIDLVLHRNPGITFDIPVPLSLVAVVTIGILLFLIDRVSSTHKTDPMVSLGAIAVIVGATNNLIDRITNGFTTDYLMFFNTSIINGSDVLIVLGAACIFWYTRRNPHALRNFIQPSPPNYGVISRFFSSVIRLVRNSRHR